MGEDPTKEYEAVQEKKKKMREISKKVGTLRNQIAVWDFYNVVVSELSRRHLSE